MILGFFDFLITDNFVYSEALRCATEVVHARSAWSSTQRSNGADDNDNNDNEADGNLASMANIINTASVNLLSARVCIHNTKIESYLTS